MNQRKGLSVPVNSVFLVLELQHTRRKEGDSITVWCSRPGSGSPASYEWPLAFGMMQPAQLEDLQARVGKAVAESIMTWVGVETSLEL